MDGERKNLNVFICDAPRLMVNVYILNYMG